MSRTRRTALPDALFIGVFPGGIVYCDRTQEEHGDYRKVAFLGYRSLELQVYQPESALLPRIRKDAAEMQAQRGRQFAISACGQTVTLGGEVRALHGVRVVEDNGQVHLVQGNTQLP
jgi:hypothetical protein